MKLSHEQDFNIWVAHGEEGVLRWERGLRSDFDRKDVDQTNSKAEKRGSVTKDSERHIHD
jgi:hypothetical protein